jgi:hypothetical protein
VAGAGVRQAREDGQLSAPPIVNEVVAMPDASPDRPRDHRGVEHHRQVAEDTAR